MSAREQIRKILTDRDSFATVLLSIIIDTYGTEALSWDPVTLLLELEDDFAVDIPRPVFDRLMAGIAVLTTDEFQQSLPEFINICNVLSGELADPDNFDLADPEEIAWGIVEVSLLDPPDGDMYDFNPEIVGYISETMKASGMVKPPVVLKDVVPVEQLYVPGEYSDDPVMFNAIYDMETDKAASVDQLVAKNLKALITQLHFLQLTDGDTVKAVERLILNKKL